LEARRNQPTRPHRPCGAGDAARRRKPNAGGDFRADLPDRNDAPSDLSFQGRTHAAPGRERDGPDLQSHRHRFVCTRTGNRFIRAGVCCRCQHESPPIRNCLRRFWIVSRPPGRRLITAWPSGGGKSQEEARQIAARDTDASCCEPSIKRLNAQLDRHGSELSRARFVNLFMGEASACSFPPDVEGLYLCRRWPGRSPRD